MKKVILFIAIILSLSTLSNAQILVESFEYPLGDSIGAHGWVSNSGGATNRLFVTAPGLDFPGYQLPGVGNATTLLGTGQDEFKNLSANVSSGSVYAFFLVSINFATTGGEYFEAFLPSASITNYVARVYVRKATTSNNLAFGIIKNAIGGGGLAYSDSTYSTGITYLLVAKHEFVAGTVNDKVSLFIYSPGDVIPAFEPATPTVAGGPSTTADVTDIGRFGIRQGGTTTAPGLIMDEIYVGTDWGTLLPVELSYFTSSVNNRDVVLNWTTASELNNSGFEIEKRDAGSETQDSWTLVGNVAGNGTSNVSHNYSFADRNLNSGKYSYRLKQIDFNGNFEYFNLSNEVNISTPESFSLSQNYPNPFNPSTSINFSLPADSKVSLKIYDMSGKEVADLLNEVKTAGYYSVNFNASSLSSGVYFYSIKADNFTATKKMMLVK